MSQALAQHYEAKYAGEAQAPAAPRLIRPAPYPRDRFEACLHYFPGRFRGGRVLELAAGSGLVARSLLAAGLACESYTLSDWAEVRLAGLRRHLADPRLRVARIDAERVPEEEYGRYGAVVMIALVEHLVDPLGALQRIRRLLRPGGLLYIDTPNIAKYTRRAKLLLGRFPSTASRDEGLVTWEGQPVDLHDEGHLHYFTYRSLSELLTRRCGFRSVEKLAYASGRALLGRRADHALARAWPELFSEVCIAASA